MNFTQQCIELTNRVGSWITARDIIAREFGISDMDVAAIRSGRRKATEFQLQAMCKLIESPPCPGYVTVAAMAKHLGVTRAWVHKLVQKGQLEPYVRDKFGRDVWFDLVDLDRIWSDFTS